jgi:hypothetical protein
VYRSLLANASDPYPRATAQVFAWRKAHWANWLFEAGAYDPDARSFEFGRGGFQGSRGGPGADWFVSNVLEELDAPTEYYFSVGERALYYFANNTAGRPPSAATEFVLIPQGAHTLVNATGDGMGAPVANLTLSGLGFRDTAPTMLEPHGVPSGGDWALERLASVFLERTEGALVDNCSFWRVGGNGLMLSKYNRNATVARSEFAWSGGSAVALWGWTEEISDGGVHGVDATGGDFPRFTTVYRNVMREIGVWEKQSSAVFSAKAAQTLIRENVIFNLARAGINFNDGLGGGDVVERNVLFNTCRVTTAPSTAGTGSRSYPRSGPASRRRAWRGAR